MNERIDRLKDRLQKKYEKEYQRLLEEDWNHCEKNREKKKQGKEKTIPRKNL